MNTLRNKWIHQCNVIENRPGNSALHLSIPFYIIIIVILVIVAAISIIHRGYLGILLLWKLVLGVCVVCLFICFWKTLLNVLCHISLWWAYCQFICKSNNFIYYRDVKGCALLIQNQYVSGTWTTQARFCFNCVSRFQALFMLHNILG